MYLLFAWRYFKAKKSTNAINVIAWISILAILIGTTALILVLSVFNGFEDLVKSLYSSFYPDLKVSPLSAKTILVTPEQLNRLKNISQVGNYSLVMEEKAMLQNGPSQSVIDLKAVDENYRYVSGVADHIVKGDYDLGTEDAPLLILGAGVENALDIQADKNAYPLHIYLPRRGNTEALDLMENVRRDTIQSSAAFIIQQDFDNKYGITNLAFAKRALQLGPDEYGAIEIRLKNLADADDAKRSVQQIFGSGYRVQDRFQQNQGLYSVMNMERWIIYGVLSLILVVAAFTMISALRMLILEKQKDINVIYALGGDKNFIQRIFISEGLLLALIGGITGMLLAFVIALLQIKYHLIPLQGGSFLIDYFPVKLRWTSFVLVGFTVFVISLLAAWLPSRRIFDEEFSLRSE